MDPGAKQSDAQLEKRRHTKDPRSFPNTGLILPLVCEYFSDVELCTISMVCKAFTEALRARPDEERLIDLSDYVLTKAGKKGVLEQCVAIDVSEAVQMFASKKASGAAASRRPLWLLGGMYLRRDLMWEELRRTPQLLATLSSLTLSHVHLHVEHFEHLPSLKSLSLQSCRLKCRSFSPLSCKVQQLYLNNCLYELRPTHSVLAVGLCFRHTLTVLEMTGAGDWYEVSVDIVMLNQLKKLEYLSLDSVSIGPPSKGVVALELPCLKVLEMREIGSFQYHYLRPCEALEGIYLDNAFMKAYWFREPQETRNWQLFSLPNLEELSIGTDDFDITVNFRRNQLLETSIDIYSFASLRRLQCVESFDEIREATEKLLGLIVQSKSWAFQRTLRTGLSFNKMESVSFRHIALGALTQVLNRCPQLSEVEIANLTCKETDLLLQKPERDSYALQTINIQHLVGDFTPLSEFLQRSRLTAYSRIISQSETSISTDFPSISSSADTLEDIELRLEYLGDFINPKPIHGWPSSLGKFRRLESVALSSVQLYCCYLTQLGDLPSLTVLSIGRCLILPDTIRGTTAAPDREVFNNLKRFCLDCVCFRNCNPYEALKRALQSKRLYRFVFNAALPVGTFAKLKLTELLRGVTLNCKKFTITGEDDILLTNFPEAPNLEYIMFLSCRYLSTLEGIERYTKLKQVDVVRCRQLHDANSLGFLPDLEWLVIKGCRQMKKSAFEFVRRSPKLRFLDMSCPHSSVRVTDVADMILKKETTTVITGPPTAGEEPYSREGIRAVFDPDNIIPDSDDESSDDESD